MWYEEKYGGAPTDAESGASFRNLREAVGSTVADKDIPCLLLTGEPIISPHTQVCALR